MRRLLALAAISAVAWSCGASVAPTKVTAVTPAQGPEGQAVDVVVTGEGFLAAVVTDFGKAASSSVNGAVTVSLVPEAADPVPLDEVVLEDAHTIHARVPASVPRGLYDVRVVDARGTEATLTGAFSVVTPAESVAAFTVEPVAGQQRGVPFPVRLLAVDAAGQLVESYEESVTLTDDTGTLLPDTPVAFVRGRLSAYVRVGVLATGDVVHAADGLGRTGDSAPFDVVAGPPAQLALTLANATLTAGDCAGPLHLELQDQLGLPVPAAADEAVRWAASPQGLMTFFSDAACATPLPSDTVTLTAGAQSADVYGRVAQAVAGSVQAQPVTLPSASVPFTVGAGAPATLALSAAPAQVRAGVCAPLDVVAEDAFGNAAQSAAGELTVSATPAGAASLFTEATCASAMGTPPFTGALRVYLLAADAGTVRLDASLDGGVALAPASVDLEVLP